MKTGAAVEPLIQPGWALWLTGLPAAGKSTLATALKLELARVGVGAVVLDSDEMRLVLTPNPIYTSEERDDFYERLTWLAELLTRQSVNVIIAATANRRSHRQAARGRLPRFAEVWVRCSLDACRSRDPKGLYAQATMGAIQDFPGIHVAYEPPFTPDYVVDTEQTTPVEAVKALLTHIPFLTKEM
jgi:adenylylsulfate kinase